MIREFISRYMCDLPGIPTDIKQSDVVAKCDNGHYHLSGRCYCCSQILRWRTLSKRELRERELL